MKQILLSLFLLFSLASLPAQSSEETKIIREVHQLINQYRRSKGLKPLNYLSGISAEAQRHAEKMATSKVPFGHDGFKKRVQAVKEKYGSGAYRAAENVFYTSSNERVSKDAVQGWIDSPGHHKNLKGSYTHTGIGVAQKGGKGFYVVQMYFSKN
jgi:uncharacterized protein YkwD